MKKILALVIACLFSVTLAAQVSTSDFVNSATGTTKNTLTKLVVNASTPQAQIMATTDTSGAIGVTVSPTATSGQATVTYSGIVPCTFDNTTVAGDYVQISATTAGNCHDVGATRPTSGQIVGVVAQIGGSAGLYNILLDKSIIPTTAGVSTPCSPIGSSDTLSAAGTFATTCTPTLTLGIGSVIEVEAHGVYTTGGTASPQISLQVNAGGISPMCSNASAINPGINKTTAPWELHCFIQIATLGAPGTAYPWGNESLFNSNGGAQVGPIEWAPGPFNYTTNSAQIFSIQETGVFVTGQTITLQSFFVRQ